MIPPSTKLVDDGIFSSILHHLPHIQDFYFGSLEILSFPAIFFNSKGSCVGHSSFIQIASSYKIRYLQYFRFPTRPHHQVYQPTKYSPFKDSIFCKIPSFFFFFEINSWTLYCRKTCMIHQPSRTLTSVAWWLSANQCCAVKHQKPRCQSHHLMGGDGHDGQFWFDLFFRDACDFTTLRTLVSMPK